MFVVGSKTGTPLKHDELKSENDVGNAATEGGQTRRQAASPPPSDVFALFGSSSSSFESSNTATTPAPSSGGDLLRYVRTMIAGRQGGRESCMFILAGHCGMGYGVWESHNESFLLSDTNTDAPSSPIPFISTCSQTLLEMGMSESSGGGGQAGDDSSTPTLSLTKEAVGSSTGAAMSLADALKRNSSSAGLGSGIAPARLAHLQEKLRQLVEAVELPDLSFMLKKDLAVGFSASMMMPTESKTVAENEDDDGFGEFEDGLEDGVEEKFEPRDTTLSVGGVTVEDAFSGLSFE